MTRPFADIPVPTLHSVVSGHALRRPHATAIRAGSFSLDYASLDMLANRAARSLLRGGLVQGARVLYLGQNSPAVPVFALGANKAGAVPVPLNWRLAPAEIARIVADCAPFAIFAEPQFRHVAEQAAAGAPILPAEALLGAGDWLDPNDEPLDDQTDAEGIAVQVYTSGSTGEPKGVMISHRALNGINLLRPGLSWDGWCANDIALVQAPLGHIGAYGMMTRALFFGACAVIHPTFDAMATLRSVEEDKVTRLALVPTAIKMILDLPEARDADYSSLDTIIYGSAPITPALLREAIATFGCRFAQSYGQTETTGPAVILPPHDHVGNKLASVGLPMPATEVRITDSLGAPLPAGITGQIEIRSIANMSGYWKLPEPTANALTADGWVRTGDAGYLDADGYLFLRGRVKEMIISGAENVYPGEVEAALSTDPDISDVAVFGLPDPHWGEIVCAAVVLRAGRPFDPLALRTRAREKLAGYKVPKTIFPVTEMPLSATGKVDKAALARTLGGTTEFLSQ